MQCTICRNGHTAPGFVTVTLDRGNATVVVRGVPAEVCDTCGEYYLAEEITIQLLQRADDAVQRGAEVEILRWAAA